MSAVCFKLLVVLCLSWMMMMTEAESDTIVWKKKGQHFTIQCRNTQDPDTFEMVLNKGVLKEETLFHRMVSNGKDSFIKEGLQVDGVFPNIDFFIHDLKVEDTGAYWCVYSKLDKKSDLIKKNSQGSVLLVVTETAKDAKQECEESNDGLNLVAVAISVTVILFITVSFFFWIIYKRKTTVKRSTVHTSDVYEDMRATTRRVNTTSTG
ncbi:uncharacterized protein LOC114467968 [Gouania willdenowi]|uniref:uncharacterized protein LOC114467968 n=1 Tax=Gouania willdenowi TaxID=441366 RepID=UPI00105570F4|nr:uncharacterized protein LOC114467968 [Gouania willdenowi]